MSLSSHPLGAMLARLPGLGHTVLTPQVGRALRAQTNVSYTLESLAPYYDSGELVRVGGVGVAAAAGVAAEARIAAWVRARMPVSGAVAPVPAAWGRIRYPGSASLSPSQERAWRGMAGGTHPPPMLALLSGLPGAGKTWLSGALASAAAQAGLLVRACAPTGAAASVLERKLPGIVATTIHRMLNIVPGQGQASRPVDADLLLVDESSMLDAELLAILLDAVGPQTVVWLIGDPRQLAPVGAGAPFRDLCEEFPDVRASGREPHGPHSMVPPKGVPHYELLEPQRQSESSGVLAFSRAYAAGRVEYPPGNVHTFRVAPEHIEEEACSLVVSDRLRRRFGLTDVPRQCLVLSPVRQAKFDASTERVNRVVSERALSGQPVLMGTRFRLGDRLVFSVNDRHLGFVNGERGTLVAYDARTRTASIESDHGKVYILSGSRLDDYADWGYATTVHKAQGSEADVVILLCNPRVRFTYSMNLLYTALTRARFELLLIGDPSVLESGLRNPEVRVTALRHLLGDPALCASIRRTTAPPDYSCYAEGV